MQLAFPRRCSGRMVASGEAGSEIFEHQITWCGLALFVPRLIPQHPSCY
jgi:hypothetical protein